MSAETQMLHTRILGGPKRVLFPESGDPRIVEAARYFNSVGFGEAVLLSGPAEDAAGIERFDECADRDDWLERCVRAYRDARGPDGPTIADARKAVTEDPLLQAALLVRLGYADAGVSGSVSSTADVVRAGIRGVGLAKGSPLVSSLFLMRWNERNLAFADCGVNPEPDAGQLAHIALATADSFRVLTGEAPVVAFLSFSTMGSASHAMVDKMTDALRLTRTMDPGLAVDGEFQFDAAFVHEIGTIKAPESAVAGHANVFIFPDLNAGNIGYKIAERMGGATALGPLLQGLDAPWMDLSRGCSVSDIVEVALAASVFAGAVGEDA